MPESEPRIGWRERFREHPYRVAAAALLLYWAVTFLTRPAAEWHLVFVRAAARLWAGGELYNGRGGYLYPPFPALFALPWVAMPPLLGRFLWFLLNAVAFLALVTAAWRLSGGSTDPGPRSGRREHLIWWSGLGCGLAGVFNALAHQQVDVLIAGCLLTGVLAFSRGRWGGGAALIGAAAAWKATALAWLGWLVWRGRWVAAAVLVLAAVGLNLLPDVVRRAPDGNLWLGRWAGRYLSPMTRPGARPGAWGTEPIYNQSVAGSVLRWLAYRPRFSRDAVTHAPRERPAPPSTLKLVTYGVELVLLAFAALAVGRPGRREKDAFRLPLEASLVLLLMLLLSPMSGKAHFGTLFLPGFCLARTAFARGDRFLFAALGVAIVCANLTDGLVGGKLSDIALWWGAPFWGAVALFTGCCRALLTTPSPALPTEAPAPAAVPDGAV